MRSFISVGVALLALVSSTAAAQISLTRASPTSVQIQPGGTATLIVEGSGLAAVASARGLLCGQPVSGLNGQRALTTIRDSRRQVRPRSKPLVLPAAVRC